MSAMAASNASSPLIATPAPALPRNDASMPRGAGAEQFAQALQRRLERSESRPQPPQRPPSGAERPREPAPRSTVTGSAQGAAAGARTAETTAGGEAAAEAQVEGEAEVATKAEPAGSEAAPAPLIAGLPASIAAILQNLAGPHGPAAGGEGGDNAAPITLFRATTGDTVADTLQNRGGRWLPAAGDDAAPAVATEAQPLEPGDDGNGFAARLQQKFATEGAPPAGLEGGTVGGVPQSASAPAAARPVPMQVATPAGQSAWAEDVGSRVTLLVGRGESKAELVLTPPSLGRLEVSLTVDGDQTTAQFVAATPAARDALEQALPRLREVLQQAGIALGQANVSTSGEQQANRREGNGEGGGRGRGRGAEGAEAAVGATAPPTWLRRSDGMVDTFA